jgi:uncharacterized RDD family membrane protein YckC
MRVANNDNRLKQTRLDNNLTIDEMVRRTKVPRRYVEMIDEGRLAELPPGVYGRSYVRAFAAVVGMNADEVLDSCAAQLVDVPDPLPALREIARERTAPTLGAAIAERIREWYAARPRTTDRRDSFALPGAVYLAAGLDAVVLFLINAFVVAVAANACDVPVDVLMRSAGGAVTIVCAFTCVMYFALLAGIGGQTLGMRVCGTRLRANDRPIDLRAIGARAAEAALGGSSILVDWLCTSELPARRESHV